MLHVAGIRLLDTRESLFEQRMIAEMLYYYVCLYRKGVEVSAGVTTPLRCPMSNCVLE